MSNGPGSPLDSNGPGWIEKPLLIECDYNTNRQNLSFESAQDCSYDELTTKIKESFKLTTRPFKIRWKDDDGEQNGIHDEATLDDAIKYHHSTAESSVTMLVQISLEYNGPSRSPLVGREEQVSFVWGEVSGPQQGGDATTTGSKDAAGSSHAPTRSTDEGGTDGSILNGSVDEERDPSFHERLLFRTAREREWLRQAQASHQMIPAFDTLSTISSSFSLNTDSPLSDGLPDTDIPPQRREYYTNPRSSGPARGSEYEVPVNQSQSNYDTGISTHEHPALQEATRCSECDCVLDQIKYTCTTCGEKALTSRATLVAAKGKDRSSEPSSPTQTILARSLGSSGSSSSTVRAGYELCASCFEKDGVNHSSASSVKVSCSRRLPPTAQERAIARRSSPKRKGQLRHAFLEQFWDFRGWKVVEQDETSRHCSGCGSELLGDRYKCGICEKYTLCRACYRDVHDIHPIHPFLDMKANKPTSETRSYSEASDDTTSDDNVDEPPLKHLGYQCSNTILYGNGGGTDKVEDYIHIHPQGCNSCEKPIIGVRYQCLNCPSKPSSFNLCSDCEVKSYRVHDPMHTFLKIPRPVDIPGPLESEFPIIPILYRYPAGPAPGSAADVSDDPEAYLRDLKHSFALCDRHASRGRIVGKWYRCAFCARDLCADCEALDTHDSTHAFLVFKAPVNKRVFRQLADIENPANSPPVWHGNIYHPQRE